MKRIALVLLSWMAASLCFAGDSFDADLAALTKYSHRLSGTVEGREAAGYIRERLQTIGVSDVFALEMPVWQTSVETCRLDLSGTSIPLLPLRPNLFVSPVTPREGVTGPLLYAGSGTLAEYGRRSARDAIVVLDYDSADRWKLAFTMGAKAVLFLGGEKAAPIEAKHAGVPANFLRFYVPEHTLGTHDLRRDHAEATLHSSIPWQASTGTNVAAFLPGTAPEFDASRGPETLILASHYDTFGVVPQNSPGARGAANVAALLEAVEYFQKNRPRRNLLFLFLDNQARFHQGAREFYEALLESRDTAKTIRVEHEKELASVSAIIASLETEGIEGAPEVRSAALSAMKHQAEIVASSLKQQLLQLRIRAGRTTGDGKAEIEEEKKREGAKVLAWDNARRALHRGTPAQIEPEVGSELRKLTRRRFADRRSELELLLRIDAEKARLRERLGATWIALHATYNFSDTGPVWGVVVGDATNEQVWGFEASADSPGYYGRVLQAFREAASGLPEEVRPSAASLEDPLAGLQFATGKFVTSGTVAGTHGIYNLSLMTGYDARARDGHPADTLANLNSHAIRRFAANATRTLELVANNSAISLPRTFSDQNQTVLPRWSGGRSQGNYAALLTTGSAAEDRPASGAMMAMWGYFPPRVWEVQTDLAALPYFDRFLLEQVDTNGRFKLSGVRKDLFKQYVTLGATFDPSGRPTAISNQESLFTQTSGVTTRVNLFPSTGYGIPFPLISETVNSPLRVMDAATDAEALKSRTLTGQIDQFAFFYVFSQGTTERIKVFQPKGPVLLHGTAEFPLGLGLPLADLRTPPDAALDSAEDLWRLNESRLGVLRSRGVNQLELEKLHGSAFRTLREAGAGETARRIAALAQSTLLSRRLYPELRAAMDDLVRAVVLLLLLTIPFAFAMERLLFCASGIYARLAGFAGIFVVTFALLYWMHPGFAIASTPMIIFLAFTIILLSSLVSFILIRKFRDELREAQGQSSRAHQMQVSKMATAMAAISMGMSTMRRRPTRTLLTTITVVLLTFTILSFASFSSGVGLRLAYEGPAPEGTRGDVLLRQLDYSSMDEGYAALARGLQGSGGFTGEQWWLTRAKAEAVPYGVTRKQDGQTVWFDAVMGVSPGELERWPELAATLEGTGTAAKMQALEEDGVYLPESVRNKLGLTPGTPILLNGYPSIFAGTFDANEIRKLKNLDGKSVLPVDFATAAATNPENAQTQVKAQSDEAAQRDFLRLSPDQIAIAGTRQVRAMGGKLHVITLYAGKGMEGAKLGRQLAQAAALPVWARGMEGIERLIFTRITEVKGGLALFIPVLLGGLIIFGTLLGSISDREKEIYTFSALGLSPADVGFLFFAEAAVYAVVGGMGGQLLAQAVGLGASLLAKMGYLAVPALNYSSGNAIFANAIVMATVLISAAYPAYRASRSANPGVQRAWKLPPPAGDTLRMPFPFTVSAYDMTGVASFLAEHFRAHDDAGLGVFAARDVRIGRDSSSGNLAVHAHLVLAPFDLGVTQDFTLMATPSSIPGVDEVTILAQRRSGSRSDWLRANRVFVQDLRKQFLLWRTLSSEHIEEYRMLTLQETGNAIAPGVPNVTTNQPEEVSVR